MSEREVVVVDVKIPFWSMVVLLIKWAIAAIPAGIVIAMVYMLLTAFFRGFVVAPFGPPF